MTNAKRDDNFVPTALGVFNGNGSEIMRIAADETSHGLKVDNWPYGLIPNPDFADQPSLTDATTTPFRWIDGTSGGSTTNDTYGWAATSTSGSSMAAKFTTTAGRTCINMVVTNITKSGSSTSQQIISPITEYTGGTVTASLLEEYCIPVTAGERYTFGGDYYLESVSNPDRIYVQIAITWYTTAGVRIATSGVNADDTILNTWTSVSGTITAPATSTFAVVTVRVGAAGAVDFTGESATANWTNLTVTSSAIQTPTRALRDENFVPTLMAVSSEDEDTPIVLYTDINGRLLIDSN